MRAPAEDAQSLSGTQTPGLAWAVVFVASTSLDSSCTRPGVHLVDAQSLPDSRTFVCESLARLAQSVERKALNLVVVGLSPTVGVDIRAVFFDGIWTAFPICCEIEKTVL